MWRKRIKMALLCVMILANGALAYRTYQGARLGLEMQFERAAEEGITKVLPLAVRIGTSDAFGDFLTAASLVIMTVLLFVFVIERRPS